MLQNSTQPTISTDGNDVAGVIEIGSKMRAFDASFANEASQRILALLVMVLVVYLVYSEIRACGLCLFSYRQRQQKDAIDAIATLSRPFTLTITMLSSVDSVMTVLIARDLLSQAGVNAESPLLGVPAVMLGVGLVIGQMAYGYAGRHVGLRRLMAGGAAVMFACACFTAAAVLSGNFWLYCLAKLVVYVCIGGIDSPEALYGKWRTTIASLVLLEIVFLLFSVNTTLVWSIAVIALVGVLCKLSDGWKAMWLGSADEAGLPTGQATGAMFATRSLALIAQPFIMSALLGATESFAVIIIGLICVVCALLFFLITRRTSLASWTGKKS